MGKRLQLPSSLRLPRGCWPAEGSKGLGDVEGVVASYGSAEGFAFAAEGAFGAVPLLQLRVPTQALSRLRFWALRKRPTQTASCANATTASAADAACTFNG